MNKKHYERVIVLHDCLWAILKSWKIMLALCAAFMLLMGGYEYYSFRSSSNISTDDLIEALTDDEVRKVDEAAAMNRKLKDMEEYAASSYFMNLNAYSVVTRRVQYFVDTNYVINFSENIEEDRTSTVLSAYCTLLSTEEIAETIVDESGLPITTDDVRKMVSISGNDSDSTLNVTIVGPSEDFCEKIEKLIDERLNESSNLISQKFAEHSISVIGDNTSIGKNDSILNYQNSMDDSISSLATKVNKAADNMNPNQKKLYCGMVGIDEESQGISKKKIILGGILGIILVCGWEFLRYVFSKKVQVTNNAEGYSGSTEIVNVCFSKKKKGIIDRWIEKNRYKTINWMDETNAENYLSEYLPEVISNRNLSKVVIVNLAKGKSETEFFARLSQKIIEHGISCEVVSDIDQNTEMLKRVSNADCAIMTDDLRNTVGTQLESSAKILSQISVPVLGIVNTFS